MAIEKIMGTEIEYGIRATSGSEFDPVRGSLRLINSLPSIQGMKVLWDYESEEPDQDARGFVAEGGRELPSEEDNRLLNRLLFNGGRLYIDCAHPEYSTPECSSARELVKYEKAGERILDLCREAADQIASLEEKLILYKNNTDGKGNSYGSHENYLVARELSFDKIVTALVPFLVSRQIFAGAGKVGWEDGSGEVRYQISQRADFCETLVGLDTTANRALVNSRDEPHANREKYRRLHLIMGDSNMSEWSIYLKVGTTALVLKMAEDGFLSKELDLWDPISALKEVSKDATCKVKLKLKEGKEFSPIEIQWEYLNLAHRYLQGKEVDEETKDLLEKWQDVLERLEEDPLLLARELDWVIKKALISSYMERRGCDWRDQRIRLLDLQYHDIRRERGLYYTLERRGFVERIVKDEEIKEAMESSPINTRAYFRAACLKKYRGSVYGASWSSILFSTKESTLKRIPLLEPGRGTKAMVEGILEEANNAEELLERIIQ